MRQALAGTAVRAVRRHPARRGAARTPLGLHSPASVLALQRSAGNRAVGSLMRARSLSRACAGGCSCGGKCEDDMLDEEHDQGDAKAANHESPARPLSGLEPITKKDGAVADGGDRLTAALWADDERLQRAFHNSPSLKSSERGDPVKKLQAALVAQGFEMPRSTKKDGTMDGIWGSETTKSVRAFQIREGIAPPGGWEAGHKTLGRLDTLLKGADPVPPKPEPKPPPAPKCTVGNEAKKMKSCLQPIVIADDDGKNPTTAPSMDQSVAIWKKCCVDYEVKATQTIKKTAFKTLDESKDNTPTDEEKKLFKEAGESDCIQVFVPVQFAQDGKENKKISGGGATYDGSKKHPKVVVVEGAKEEVVAHEVGHASGHDSHDDKETVMKPTGAHDKANARAVSTDVCAKARKGTVLVGVGADKDCCQDPK